MSSNLIVPVPRETVQQWIARLNGYIVFANSITEMSTFAEISRAEVSLHKARELFSVLWDARALENWREVEDDLNRIEAKVLDMKKEKHKNYRPEVRRS